MSLGVTVAVSTRDRPAGLRASLCSHVTQALQYGTSLRLLVLDESASVATQEQNRRTLVEVVHGNKSISAHYLGPGDKKEWSRRLAKRSGVPLEVTDFALLGWPWLPAGSGGANLNTFLLQIAGSRGLHFDDDVLCQVARAPRQASGWALSSAVDPTGIDFFGSREEAFQEAKWIEQNVHEELSKPLGKSIDELVDHPLSAQVNLGREAGPWAAESKADECPPRVAISTLGLRGDSGMAHPAYLLKLRGDNRARLLQGGADRFTQVLQGRQVGRGVSCSTLSKPTYFQSYGFGLDATEGLPPFLPAFRGSDTFFAGTLQVFRERAMICHLPWQIRHEPPEARRVELTYFSQEAGQATLGHWLHAVLRMFQQSQRGEGVAVSDPARHLSRFGRLLQELAALPELEGQRTMEAWVRMEQQREVAVLDQLLQEHEAQPECWACLVRNYRQAILQNLDSPYLAAPQTIPRLDHTPIEKMRLMMKLFHEFGRLVEAWPAIFAAAQEA